MSQFPADAVVGFDHGHTTHECRRCGVQWARTPGWVETCWMCGEPGVRMNRPNTVFGMTVAFYERKAGR